MSCKKLKIVPQSSWQARKHLFLQEGWRGKTSWVSILVLLGLAAVCRDSSPSSQSSSRPVTLLRAWHHPSLCFPVNHVCFLRLQLCVFEYERAPMWPVLWEPHPVERSVVPILGMLRGALKLDVWVLRFLRKRCAAVIFMFFVFETTACESFEAHSQKKSVESTMKLLRCISSDCKYQVYWVCPAAFELKKTPAMWVFIYIFA